MNTLNIYLSDSGSTAEVEIDFRLFKDAYQNKLIDIYVPISLLYTNEQSTFVTSVKTGAILTATNGERITTNSYYANYIGDKTVNGVAYAVYEQNMPKEYTTYVGNQVLVANVINIDNTDTENPVVLNVVTSQTVQITVQESAYVGDQETIEPSDLETLWGVVNSKENMVDTDIDVLEGSVVTSQRVSTAINELNTQVTTNTGDIDTQGNSISDLSERVTDLENSLARQENPIGEMNLTALPTDEQVSAYVYSVVGRQPQISDVVIVNVNSDGVINSYKYLYTVSGWVHYQIEYQSKAENDVAGLIEGTYGINGYNQPISANIVNGQIITLYYKDGQGVYQQVATRLNTNTQTIANIIDGTQVVGEAVKATEDSNGNNIASTYAHADDVYTKSQSDLKYLPKTYTDVYYYASSGLVDEVPTTPADGVQFTANIPTTGEVQLASCGRTLSATYHFTKNSTDESRIWLMTDTNTTLQLRLLTQVTSNGQTELLASQLTSDIEFTANEPKEVILDSIYNNLGNIELDVEAGETFTKILYVTSVDNTASTIELISSIQYASSFNLAVQSISFDVNTISGIKTISILSSQWTQNLDGSYSITIPQTTHGQAPTNKYFLSLQEEVATNTYEYIAFTPQVDADGNITITSDYALDCDLLIASATQSDARGILTATNPTVLPTIDYEQSGALRILQNTTATALTLNNPLDTGKFYTFFVANDNSSTETISVNGQTIEIGSGVQFKWVGQWQTGITPTDTAEIYDSVNSQPLNTTLTGMQTEINGKQDALTAGSNISIDSDNIISATDTTYTAGTNVSISAENVISATDTTYTAGTGLSLNNGEFSVDTTVVQEKLTAGSGITIDSDNVISASGGSILYKHTITAEDNNNNPLTMVLITTDSTAYSTLTSTDVDITHIISGYIMGVSNQIQQIVDINLATRAYYDTVSDVINSTHTDIYTVYTDTVTTL